MLEFNVCVFPPNIPKFETQCPCVTFVSSTLFGEYHSLTDVIFQHVIETWTANQVPIASFEHLWLIKSFSIIIYRNVISLTLNSETKEFLDAKGINDLLNMVNYFYG